jgi:hypothetical protein
VTEQSKPGAPNESGVYQIKVEGHLGHPRAHWFGDVTVAVDADGNTLLTCTVVDQAALHGVLRQIRDLGLPLLSVTRSNPEREDPADRQL